jgi:formylglycine-generating enzyme required for sulfatase activity
MHTHHIGTQLIGDYEIIRDLGQGMLGKVFLARHRFLKKLTIVKALPEELSKHPSFIERFEKEVVLLGAVDHPHIVKMDTVICIDEVYYLVTECHFTVQGEFDTLATYLQKNKGKILEGEVLTIARQVASALDYAHGLNIHDEPLAHRGFKFNNVILAKKDEVLEVKISDLGLSRIVGIGAVLCRSYRFLWEMMAFSAGFKQGDAYLKHFVEEDGDLLKLHDTFSQYYAFLAPEQKGRVESTRDQDVKADVYAFGIMLYYLLCSTYPEGFFPMPSECNLSLEHNWNGIIKACLNIDPQQRPLHLTLLLDQELKRGSSRRVKIKPAEISRPEYEPDPAAAFQTDKTVVTYKPKVADVSHIEPITSEMVVIQEGTFLRGCNNGARDEMPRHAVHLAPFAIDIHPINNEQFVRFLTVMGGEKDANNNDMIRLRDSRIRRNGGKLTIESGYAKHPVAGVTWYGSMAYAKWIGKRLPTEAEWEIAACGGDGASYPTGEEIERSQANFFSSDTTAVMSYPANKFGLFDMAGNIYEWCSDWYGYHYYETSMHEPHQPTGPPQGVYRVLRGGCWKSLKEDMRCSHRHRNNPGSMNGTYGFRCAADVQ